MAQRLADLASSGAVAAHHLSKRYGSLVAVDDVSFEVEVGEIFGIVGPNGAGKTTIVECLQGLRRPDGGDLSVLGLDPNGEPRALRRRVGSQLQESALPDRIKVWEALDLFGATVADATAREVLLREWGLDGRRNARFADLSGGQQQCLFVALALVNQPALVFLDEMTTGLDPAAAGRPGSSSRGSANAARQSSSSPTSWTRQRSSATALRSSATAASSHSIPRCD